MKKRKEEKKKRMKKKTARKKKRKKRERKRKKEHIANLAMTADQYRTPYMAKDWSLTELRANLRLHRASTCK